MKKQLSITLLIIMSGCSGNEETLNGRWYTATQINNGEKIFENNCALCHDKEAQGTVSDWNKPFADNSYPPPPLDGGAHARHHPLRILQRTIWNGGIQLGGTMQGFKDKLNVEEINSAIAFFQSKRNNETYKAWIERDGFK